MTKAQLMRFKSKIIKLYQSNPKIRKIILKHSSNEFIRLLSEIALNVLKAKIPLNVKDKKKLNKYKSAIRKLASSNLNTQYKRGLLMKGGFLSLFLKPLVKILGEIF